MSEKIVLEITPEVAAKIRDFLASSGKIAPAEADAWDQIIQQLGGNLERSVLEWHTYPAERPTAQMVLVDADACFSVIVPGGLETFAKALGGSVRWAEVPRDEKENGPCQGR